MSDSNKQAWYCVRHRRLAESLQNGRPCCDGGIAEICEVVGVIRMTYRELQWPTEMLLAEARYGDDFKLIKCILVNECLRVCVTKDNGLLHLSVSCEDRYPSWDEIKTLRYTLLPNDKTFGLILPPAAEYVNVHPNCFHLHEIPEIHGL